MTDQEEEKQKPEEPAETGSGESAEKAEPKEKPAEKPAIKKEEPPSRPAPPENPVAAVLQTRFEARVTLSYGIRDLEVRVTPENLIEVCDFLKNNPSYPHKFLRNLTAVDWPKEDHIEVIYHIAPFPDMATVCVKCRVPRAGAELESVTTIWPSANWLEREVFDLFGVHFKNHPDLRRIMLPPEWEGHPLRKDYEHKEPDLPCLKRNSTPTN